jgi:serine/threonine-protein kinase
MLAQAPMISTNKASIGRYEILSEIGRGAMGVVFRARDPQLDRIVAIKTVSLLDLEPGDEKEFRERFQQEARTAARLSHPGIVAIYDVGIDPETNAPYIVMEYVAGNSLTKLLNQENGKVPLNSALQIVQEVALALHYAHSEGVTHRDVKPANILLTPEGKAKLADFGIARLDQSHLTLPGRLLGSPAYMAPEQMKGEKVDGRSDLFALGVVLYRLSTGYRPLQGNSTATVCYKLLRQDPLPPSALNAELPPHLDDFLNRAMAKDPAHRFQTGDEMAEAIQQLRESIETQQDPLAPLRRLIDRTGVSHAPPPPFEPILEVALASVIPGERKLDLSQPKSDPVPVLPSAAPLGQAKPSTVWMKVAVISAPLVVALAGAMVWKAHLASDLARQESAAIGVRTSAPQAGSEADTNSQTLPTEPEPPQTVAAKPAAKKMASVKKRQETLVSRTNVPAEVRDKPNAAQPSIVVHNMAVAQLNVVVEHSFETATASILVDRKPIFSQELHGESRRRALLFRRTQGKQSGTINMLPGKHDISVRVQSPNDGYDVTKTFSEGFAQGSSRVLLIKCDKRKNKLETVLR